VLNGKSCVTVKVQHDDGSFGYCSPSENGNPLLSKWCEDESKIKQNKYPQLISTPTRVDFKSLLSTIN